MASRIEIDHDRIAGFNANKDKIDDLAEKVDREKLEDMAETAVDKVDDMTDGKVPDAVHDMVDKIDGVDDDEK